ncbi:glycoside hydrolase family 95 protein [Plenodomus tracheiphilus IPT5]|uniref:Glycoside hydrolase family 95 protein n=1 Tax=Plenodomus tracheiphilus IPT5 TaxID=1408161 RepID=A0A6A7AU03_9PLEO|nr:glycoside hydrolase family 95 protein [Plenodomus tracheiphilus IPT5]
MAKRSLARLLVVSIVVSTGVVQAKSLWSRVPANASDIIRTAYPLGNGRLGAMPYGPAGQEVINLNLDSLWSGGPFDNANYTGGNPTSPVAQALPGIRDWIFTNGTGNVTELLGNDNFYGSYQVLGNLSVTIPSHQGNNISITEYTRTLDLTNGIHTTQYKANGDDIETTIFCSFPDQVCVYNVQASGGLPELLVGLDNGLVNPELKDLTCGSDRLRLRGVTQLIPQEGMRYEAIARVISAGGIASSCANGTTALSLTPTNGTKSVTIVVGAGTNYDQKKGTAESGYSFRSEDPGPLVESTTQKAAARTLAELEGAHIKDFNILVGRFELNLPDNLNSSQVPTADLIERYNSDNIAGDPYLESLLFDYGNYLFISSSRPGSLPPNLQGRWSEGLFAAWSADYHANINLQMNHWTADQTGLTDLQSPLWDYMTENWVPRGHETAELVYGAPGWVVHNEMNIFGHTGMKSGASWANYAAAAAWMMQHVFDHWDYSRDTTWLTTQGYPLLKGVAEFWLSQLQPDTFTNDNSLVVNPCNSPEHGPTTFACAHFQQLIHQVFDAVLTLSPLISDPDTAFTTNISTSLSRLDKGFHIGSFSQIKEWKLPDSYGYEFENDTHRHLSELVGWYPGYSLSSFLSGYTNNTISSAVRAKLISRGNGNGADANAGWAKVWRAACWARLNDTQQAHFHLRYAIQENFADNGLSMYSGVATPFQIDANFGLGGAVLSMLVVDLPVEHGVEGVREVVLGPAIPKAWGEGNVKGLRVRGGGVVDFEWDGEGMVRNATVSERALPLRVVNVRGDVLVEV